MMTKSPIIVLNRSFNASWLSVQWSPASSVQPCVSYMSRPHFAQSIFIFLCYYTLSHWFYFGLTLFYEWMSFMHLICFFICSFLSGFCLFIVAFIVHFMPDNVKITLLSITLNCIPHALHAWKLLYKYRLFFIIFLCNSSRSSSIFTAPCFCVSLCRYDDGDAHQRPARLRARHPGEGREVDAL